MAKNVQSTYSKSLTPDLRQFTIDFFGMFQAQVSPLDSRRQDALHVALPQELADHFGKPELKLAFHHVEQGGELELVAHGSRTFDRMLAFLDRRSALTLLNLPNRFTSSEELLAAIRPVNTSIAGLRMQEQMARLFVFHWRITYRADDKREELYTIVLDEHGERMPLRGEANDGAGLDLDRIFADAVPALPEPGAPGTPPQWRLPPMTQLVRLAETARKYAIYHADLRCVSHEAEILPRLYQTLNRLTTYYGQQIEEVYDAHDPTGEKRRALEVDLERKLAEEVENHRLRVQVVLVSYAVLHMPAAVAEVVLSDGKRSAPVQVMRNRYSGVIQRPACHACGAETTVVALDRNEHITCDNCLCQCAACQEIICAACGVEPCPLCQKQNCDECGKACWACGGRACAEHLSVCPVCGDEVCHACQAECSHCGVRQCRTHLRADAVLTEDDAHWVCGACAVRCPGCQQYSATVRVCSASGQRFCANCAVSCARCGDFFGPGYFRVNPLDGSPYCVRCLQECPVCQSLTAEVFACAVCGATCCTTCGFVCDLCRHPFCTQHAQKDPECGHVVCHDHAAHCGVGGEDLCAVCHTACGICERHYCADHSAQCRRCEREYCRECVRASSLCDTCATIGKEGEPVRLANEPCASERSVAVMAPHHTWLRATNRRYTIYLGQGALMAAAIVVVEATADGPRVVLTRKLSLMDSIRDKLTR
jgi:hypothetical protein